MMKVLLVHRDIGTGSVGKIVEDLYFGIAASGNECKVAYGYINKSKIPIKDLISVCDEKTIKKHALYSRLTDRTGFYGKKQTEKLVNFIENYKPDIIHVHGLYGYWIDIATLYSYLKNTDMCIVNTLHSCWDFTGHCCYFTKADCKRWQDHCYKCPEKKKYPSSLFIDNSFNNYERKKELSCSMKNMHLIAPSEWIARCAKQSFLKSYDTHVINNGIDIAAFRSNSGDVIKYSINIEKKVILGVASNWEERKGLNDFIELSDIISDDYQIVLVGLSKKQINILPNNIIGIQRTDSKEDLAAIYSAATVFFNPTYEDNYPTVNLEAIACGTPFITYRTGGSPEIVERLSAGYVIKEKDYKRVLQLTDYYSSNPLTLTKADLAYLSKERMVEEYLNFYYLISEGKI